ncbi:MAG: hypothetical protein ABI612_24385 [Betaproteobacteria bacterium]
MNALATTDFIQMCCLQCMQWFRLPVDFRDVASVARYDTLAQCSICGKVEQESLAIPVTTALFERHALAKLLSLATMRARQLAIGLIGERTNWSRSSRFTDER